MRSFDGCATPALLPRRAGRPYVTFRFRRSFLFLGTGRVARAMWPVPRASRIRSACGYAAHVRTARAISHPLAIARTTAHATAHVRVHMRLHRFHTSTQVTFERYCHSDLVRPIGGTLPVGRTRLTHHKWRPQIRELRCCRPAVLICRHAIHPMCFRLPLDTV